MTILIKSAPKADRKVQMLSQNSEKKDNQEQDLRSTLISLLRGMKITLELKVNDVLVASSNFPVNIEEPSSKSANDVRAVETETSIQAGSEKFQEPPQQVPEEIEEFTPSESLQNLEPAPAPAPAPVKSKTSISFAPLQALRIRPEVQESQSRPDPPAVKAEIEAAGKVEKLEEKPVLQSKAPAVPEPVPQPKLSPKPVNKPPQAKVPNKPFLIRGDLKIGSSITTVSLSVASEDPIVVYVTYDQKKLVESVIKIQEIADAIEAQSMIKSVDVGDIIFGKSNEDDTWYRGVVMSTNVQQIEIYFFDWGITETLDITRVRRLTELGLGLAKFPACAVKVRFTDESKPYLNDVLGCEKRFSMKVESFDQDQEIYTGTVTKILPDE